MRYIVLGGSLRDVLVRLKAQPEAFPTLNIEYAAGKPLAEPLNVTLPDNGLRLRFDGPDQRLRLIEVVDFSKIPLTYKGTELVKIQDAEKSTIVQPCGPAFRQIYSKLFGPTFEGEYFVSSNAPNSSGIYVLSYPGVAFSFKVFRWPDNSDFVSVLSSSSASPAKSLSIFNGSSWKDACRDLYTRPCPHPRSLVLGGKSNAPDEIELVIIKGSGHVEMRRRTLPTFNLILGETTPQDLVATLGPPDAIYRKNDRRLSIHKEKSNRADNPLTSGSPGVSDTDRSSLSTATDYSSPDEDALAENDASAVECFYNYFNHGFDIFVSYPSISSPPLIPSGDNSSPPVPGNQLVATKILLHGNVPGSHSFNRYRRSRWVLDPGQIRSNEPLTSETPFIDIKSTLNDIWEDALANEKDGSMRHMVLNRGWGDSPGSSIELLGGWESTDSMKIEDLAKPSLGNTELYGFPGLLFEVLKNDTVSCITVY
jgi:isoleucyl-tRNA synthetase